MNKSTNVVWQDHSVSQSVRESLKSQQAMCIWFTGLSGAGKSTLANLLEQRLAALGRHTYLLDGDNVRHGLNRDLGFSDADRSENIRRAAEVARLMVDAGLIVIVSFISPFDFERKFARSLFTEGRFKEVYVKASLAVCEARDTKGLYAKARLGQLPNFTGIDSPYEEPSDAEIVIETDQITIEEAVSTMLHVLGID